MVLAVVYIDGALFGFETDLQKASTFGLFIVGIVFATLIELIAGFVLDKLFHARWWDYRGMKFNLNGYMSGIQYYMGPGDCICSSCCSTDVRSICGMDTYCWRMDCSGDNVCDFPARYNGYSSDSAET